MIGSPVSSTDATADGGGLWQVNLEPLDGGAFGDFHPPRCFSRRAERRLHVARLRSRQDVASGGDSSGRESTIGVGQHDREGPIVELELNAGVANWIARRGEDTPANGRRAQTGQA